MAIFHKHTRKLLLGVGIGAGAVVTAPYLLALLRPLLKAIVKQSFLAFERIREAAAHAAEELEDVVAEVRSELESELGPAAPGPEEEEEAGIADRSDGVERSSDGNGHRGR